MLLTVQVISSAPEPNEVVTLGALVVVIIGFPKEENETDMVCVAVSDKFALSATVTVIVKVCPLVALLGGDQTVLLVPCLEKVPPLEVHV